MIAIPRAECHLSRKGRSHELALRGLLECASKHAWTLVHGKVTTNGVTRDQAWLECRRLGLVYSAMSDAVDSIETFNRRAKAIEISRYTADEARALYVKTAYSGPWHEKEHDLTHAEALNLFDYDHKAGALIWRRGPHAGLVAGGINHDGYRVITVRGQKYQAHRVIWLHVHGEWPALEIDHVDGNRDNNRLVNLRDVPAEVNQGNIHTVTFTGLPRGVRISSGRYAAYYASRYISTHDTPEQAHEAYKAAHVEALGCESPYYVPSPAFVKAVSDFLKVAA